MPGVEIELYDVGGISAQEDGFDADLAERRRREREAARTYRADEYAERRVQEEIEAGLTLRRRQTRSRLTRPGNVILTLASISLVAAAAVVIIWWGMARRLTKSESEEGAYVAPTNVALNVAVKLEEQRRDTDAQLKGPRALLTVIGDGGRVYVNGDYVADAPAREVPIPAGVCRVVVKRGNTIRIDETVDAAPGVHYTLAVGEARVLAPGGGNDAVDVRR